MATNQIPFSQINGGLYIGQDFLCRLNALDNSRSAQGLTDSFSDFHWHKFNPANTHPMIQSFYERTVDYRVLVEAEWKPGFRVGGRIFRFFARRIQQMGLPLDSVDDREMLSRIDKVSDTVDGRNNVRAWVRTYLSSGDTVYVALYANHVKNHIPYMNIAFPLPGGNLTSILRVDPHPTESDGLVLSTFPFSEERDDAGIYFANRIRPFRLPFNETITVWMQKSSQTSSAQRTKAQASSSEVILARHDIWLFKKHFLAINYTIERQ